MNAWTPDVDLIASQAAGLIDSQFSELAPARLQLIGEGYDNWAYRVNDRWVFRFPRRKLGAELLDRELRALPLLAPHLTLPASCPHFFGSPGDGYPYSFAGYPYLTGETACRVQWTDSERAANASILGRFLAQLHRIPVDHEVRAWAPIDMLRRADLPYRAPMIKERLARIEIPDDQRIRAEELVDSLTHTPAWSGPTCWLHGDLYARHLIVNRFRRVTGVIDWGDVHLGDPAEDISIAFSFLPGSARAEFRAAYGPIDDATWSRARFRSIFYGAFLMHYGQTTGDQEIASAGFRALEGAGAGA